MANEIAPGDNTQDWFANQPAFREWMASQQQQQAPPQAQTPPQPSAAGPQRQEWTRANVAETLKRYGAPTQQNLARAVAENPWLGQLEGNGKIRDVYGTGHTWDVIGNIADQTGATTHWQTLTGNTARAAAAKGGSAKNPNATTNVGGPNYVGGPTNLPPTGGSSTRTGGGGGGATGTGGIGGQQQSVQLPDAPTMQRYDPSTFNYQALNQPMGQLGYNAFQDPTAFEGNRQVAPEAFGYEAYQAPDAFRAPTAEEAANDPGYQFGLQQSQNALQNQAASKGILQSKNFVSGMSDLNRQAAQQQYGDVYGRRFGEYNVQNANDFAANQANNAGRLGAYSVNTANQLGVNSENYARDSSENQQGFQNAFAVNQANNAGQNAATQGNNQNALAYQGQQFEQGLAAYGANTGNQMQAANMNNQNALGLYGAQTNAALGLGNLNLGYQNSNNQYALGQRGLDLGFQNSAQDYTLGRGNLALGQTQAANSLRLGLGNLGVAQGQLGLAQQGQNFNQNAATYGMNYQANVTDPWTRYYQMAQLGNPGAPSGQQYANSQSDLLTGQGNANAAGQVGSGNAYSNAAGQIGNYAQQQAYMQWLNSRQTQPAAPAPLI